MLMVEMPFVKTARIYTERAAKTTQPFMLLAAKSGHLVCCDNRNQLVADTVYLYDSPEKLRPKMLSLDIEKAFKNYILQME